MSGAQTWRLHCYVKSTPTKYYRVNEYSPVAHIVNVYKRVMHDVILPKDLIIETCTIWLIRCGSCRISTLTAYVVDVVVNVVSVPVFADTSQPLTSARKRLLLTLLVRIMTCPVKLKSL